MVVVVTLSLLLLFPSLTAVTVTFCCSPLVAEDGALTVSVTVELEPAFTVTLVDERIAVHPVLTEDVLRS